MPKPTFDIEQLTLGEVATIEDLSGSPISAIEHAPQGKFLAALLMVAKRRGGEPAFTFNQALGTPMTEANAYLGFDGDDDADDDAGEPEPAELAEIEAEGNADSSPDLAHY